MAKDNRRIIGGIQIGDRVFVEGEEDELEEAMAPSQLAHLEKQGALEGDWSAKANEPAPMARPNAAAQPAPAPAQEARPPLSRMKSDDLRALAKDEGLTLADDATNKDIREALKAAGVE